MRAGILRGKETPIGTVATDDYTKMVSKTTGRQYLADNETLFSTQLGVYNAANNRVATQVALVTVTTAQVLALNATPVSCIAAPGAGYAIIIKDLVITKAAGTAYAGIAAGEDLTLKYTNSSGAVAATAEMTSFADSTSLTITRGVAASVLPVANAAIVAHMATGEITTGDSDFKLRIEYQVVPVPVF